MSSVLVSSQISWHTYSLPTCCRCLYCPRMFVFIEIWETTKNLPDSFPFDSDLFFFSPSLTHAHTHRQPYSILVLSSFQLRALSLFLQKKRVFFFFYLFSIPFFLLITSQSLFPFLVSSTFFSSSVNPLLVVLFHFRGSFSSHSLPLLINFYFIHTHTSQPH